MTDYTPHQRKIIDRYYSQRDGIMLGKLSDLVAELYLASTDKKRQQLWKRAETAMKNLKVPEPSIRHILERQSPEVLAEHVREWLGMVR